MKLADVTDPRDDLPKAGDCGARGGVSANLHKVASSEWWGEGWVLTHVALRGSDFPPHSCGWGGGVFFPYTL